MLSLEQLKELGRFKMMMRKIHNETVQIEKFLVDVEYQTQMLDIGEQFDENDLDNDELMMLSLVIRSKFGRLSAGEHHYNAPPPSAPVAPKVKSGAQTKAAPDQSIDAEENTDTKENSKNNYFTGLR